MKETQQISLIGKTEAAVRNPNLESQLADPSKEIVDETNQLTPNLDLRSALLGVKRANDQYARKRGGGFFLVIAKTRKGNERGVGQL